MRNLGLYLKRCCVEGFGGLRKLEYRGYDSAGLAFLNTTLQTKSRQKEPSGMSRLDVQGERRFHGAKILLAILDGRPTE